MINEIREQLKQEIIENLGNALVVIVSLSLVVGVIVGVAISLLII